MATVNGRKLHILFLPWLTPSHMVPLTDVARLFASREVKVTVIATPGNVPLIKTSIDRSVEKGHDISILTVKFPADEVGLPKGIEHFNAVNSPDQVPKLYHATILLKEPIENLIVELLPDCIFSDPFFTWTVDLAEQLRIPRLCLYHWYFALSLIHSLKLYKPHEKVESDSESFLVPGLPDKIEMKGSQLEEHLKRATPFGEMIKQVEETMDRSYGAVINTFYEMEPAYAEHYKKINGKKCWYIGPAFSFINKEVPPIPSTNNERHSSLEWLDSRAPNSVVYCCFGSLSRFPDAQLNEMALGLEASGHPFIWVVRREDKTQETWLPEGFEERIRKSNKGLIIKGWAPQKSILEHPATGSIINSCGACSITEAILAGVPLITWPLFAEQFQNEKLVQVLGIGIPVGQEFWNATFEITSPVVGRDKVEAAVKRLMCDSEESRKIRRRTKEMKELANRSTEKGGSSYNDLNALIAEIKNVAATRAHGV